jgi:hypothetical protein
MVGHMTDDRHLRGGPRKRQRATKAEMEHRYAVLTELAADNRPASVRNLYYRAVVAGLVPKTESGYQKVQRALVELRRCECVPYEWITDSVRWRRKPTTWESAEQALESTARTYRQAVWTRSPVTVEVWCESDSIAGVIFPVTDRWDVPLLPVRGYSSLTFAYESAQELNAQRRDAVIYYVGDHDRDGLRIEAKLREYLDQWCAVPVKWQRLAVTWEQVEELGLPGTPPKRDYGYPLAVEAEAMPPNDLRHLVDEAIRSHVGNHELAALEAAEESERRLLARLTSREFVDLARNGDGDG